MGPHPNLPQQRTVIMSDVTKPSIDEKDRLTGINYLNWAFLMQMVLVHADLWDITVSPPAEALSAVQLKASQKALALIVFNISMTLIPVIRLCKTAAEAWKKLESLYAVKNEYRIQHVREQLSAICMGANENVTSYFARARGLWHELTSLGHATLESDVVWPVLKGLPARFSVLVTVLRSSPTVLTLDSALGQLLSVELVSDSSPVDERVTQALVASASPPPKVCHYCKKPGHLIRDCRKRIAAEARRAASDPSTSAMLAASSPLPTARGARAATAIRVVPDSSSGFGFVSAL